MSYQSLIVNAERIAVGSGLQQENIFGMIESQYPFSLSPFLYLVSFLFSTVQIYHMLKVKIFYFLF